jgi:DNA-binding transcriptional regulator YiaG
MGDQAWDRQRQRYAEKMRELGTPLLVTPQEFEQAARLLKRARQYGMSDRMIGEQTGVHDSLPSKVRRGRITTIHRDTFERIMRMRPERPVTFVSGGRGKVGTGPQVSPTGTIRRVQALRADGFPGWLLGERLGVSYEAVAQLARSGRKSVMATTRADVARMYAELEGKRPEDFGVGAPQAAKCATWARRAGYVPRSCWDSDTIHDPSAQPEWTGRCGTPFGILIHERDEIPVCPRCAQAKAPLKFSGERLRAARHRAGLTQRNLERMLGVGQGHVHHWESGRYGPRKHRLYPLMAALDITFEDIYETEQEDGR